MAKLYNLARMTTATTGAGAITLGAAVSGFLTFDLAGVANGDVVSYGISDGANGEVGTGTYTTAGTTLTRTPTKSTNANAAISLSGTAQVFITARAEDINVLSNITASLGADVALNNSSNYFDGPSVAQGTAGTWFVCGTVAIQDTIAAGANYNAKLWDGTTIIDSGFASVQTATNCVAMIELSGIITSPAANLRISCKSTSTNSNIKFNLSGNSKDCTISAVRLA